MKTGLRWLVTAVVALVGAATLFGLLDRFSWVFEVLDAFRLQYLVVLVASAAAALALRRTRLAAVAVALAAVNAAVIGISGSGPPKAALGPTDASLRLLVANVEVGNRRFDAVQDLVEETRPDVVGIVELTPALAKRLRRTLRGYRWRRLAPRGDAYGIGVFSRLPFAAGSIERFPAKDGPETIVVRVRLAREPVTVVVTHVRTPLAGSIHVRQLQALARARRAFGDRVVLCGDFNTPPWSGPFRRFEADAGLTDLYGNRAWSAYTWPTWSSLLRLPLDNCLVSDGLAVTDHRNGPDIGSDHFPLLVDLAIGRTETSRAGGLGPAR